MKNKMVFIFSVIIVFSIVCMSFFEVVNDYIPNYIEYYKIEKKCPGEYNFCKPFKTKDELLTYLKENNPKKKFDAITLSVYVVETSEKFGLLVFLLPLIVIVNVVFKIHDEISSGYIKNKLNRMKYSDILKEYFSSALKSALLVPLIYTLIFLSSCVITGFNFNLTKDMQLSPGYENFKYNYFLLYSLILILIQYILFFGYAVIGIFMSFISKSKIVSIILGYVYFVILCIAYLAFGAIVIKNVFGINYGEINYFNLIGNYWFFNDLTNPVFSFIVVLSIVLLNCLIVMKLIGNKEKGIIQYEKHSS